MITYNDHHTTLAGYAIEQLSNAPFHEVMRTHLFTPLGMVSSTFNQAEIVGSTDAPLARSYRVVDGAPIPYVRDLIMTAPAAGLATTAADMGRYMAHLLAGADRDALMPNEFYQRQLSVQFRNNEHLRGRSYGFAETSHEGHLVLYKDGQANGFGARMVLVPDAGIGIFIAVNRSILGEMGAPNEAARFMRNYTSALLEAAIPSVPDHNYPPPAPLPNASSEQYAGTYRTTVAARHTWEKLLSAMDVVAVTALPDGSIDVGSNIYVPIGDSVFQYHQGGPYYVGFEFSEDDTPQYLLIGSGSYERVPWYGAHMGAGAVVLGVAVLAIAMLVSGAMLRRKNGLIGWSKWAMGGSALRLAFVASLMGTLILMDPQVIFYGMPTGISLAVGLALLAVLFDATAAFALARQKSRTPFGTSVAVIYLASSGVFVWWLQYWNLLGWQTV